MNAHPPILVAEDDPTEVMLLRMAHKKSGLHNPLVFVHDGQEAVDYLADSARNSPRDLPALALLDLKMPRLDGFDVLRWVAGCPELKEKLPVVVLSSSSQDGDIEKARKLGAREYCVKPYTVEDLAKILSNLSLHWLSTLPRNIEPKETPGEAVSAPQPLPNQSDIAAGRG